MVKKRNKKTGRWINELADPALVAFYLEAYDRDWLREEALKRKTTLSDIIRNAIRHLRKK